MIQQGINQLLTTAGVFARLSPTLEASGLSRQRTKEMRHKETAASFAKSAGDTELETSINKEIADLAAKEFEANPSEETYSALAAIKNKLSPETVMQGVASKGLASVEQRRKRRDFMDYLRKMPSSFGGTVGELDPKLQRTIAKSYSKAERRTIMDRMDKEATNG